MIVYLNANGTIEQVVPQNLTQGSNNETLIVIGANLSDYTSLNAIFKLPNGQVVAPRLMTKQDSDYVLNNEIVNVWTCKINKSITNFSGTLNLTIDATDVNGVKVNSYTGAVQIAPTNAPSYPKITESAEDIFNQIFEAYGYIQGRLASKQDSYDENLQTTSKEIVGAINELNAKETENAGDIMDLETQIEYIKNGDTVVGRAMADADGDNIVQTYQKKADNGLETVSKTVVGGINELKDQTIINAEDIQTNETEISNIKRDYATTEYVDKLYETISMGGSKSYTFETKQQFLDWLDGTYERPDGIKPSQLNIGDMILIVESGIPDYWLKSKSDPITINDFAEYEAKIEIEETKIDNISITKNTQGELQAVKLKNAFINVGTSTITYEDLSSAVKLSQEQFDTLAQYGSVQVGGQTISFDNNAIYITPETPMDDVEQLRTDVNGIINNTTIIRPNANESILVGSQNAAALTSTQSVIIGKNAKTVSKGVAIGYDAMTTVANGGVAVGDYAETENGVAIGREADALGDGVAIGNFAETEDGIAIGGNETKPAQAFGSGSIQLGGGTNYTDNTLQIGDDSIYNYSTHTMNVKNLQINGVDVKNEINSKAAREVVDQNTVDIGNLQSSVSQMAPKVARALLTPMSAPVSTELVAVDDGNSQTMIEIGEGLVVENNTLKSTGGTKIIDNLTSTNISAALSANQGRILNNSITALQQDKLDKTGGTMNGTLSNVYGIVVGKDNSSANNTKGIVFGENGLTKIGASSSLGLYAERNIYFRPGIETDDTAGLAMTRTAFYPTDAKSMSLGGSSNYFDNIYGTTIYQNGNKVLDVGGGTMEGDIKLPAGKFIVDESGYGLVGYYGTGAATFGNGNRGINLRGNTTRPKYNSNDVAMLSDMADRVIETSISSDNLSGYRIWASGWKECWCSQKDQPLSNYEATIQLPLPSGFDTLNYSLQITPISGADDNFSFWILNRTETSFTWRNRAGSGALSFYACGY